MKPIRLITLGLIGAVVVRQIQQNRQTAWNQQRSLANDPEHLLPARTKTPSSPRQSAVASRDTHLPEYNPQEPPPSQRQPANTPASQQITGEAWTNNTPTRR